MMPLMPNTKPRSTPPTDPPPAAPAVLPAELHELAAGLLRAGGTGNEALARIGASKRQVEPNVFVYSVAGSSFHVGSAWSLSCYFVAELRVAA